jgi:hypothetical protein
MSKTKMVNIFQILALVLALISCVPKKVSKKSDDDNDAGKAKDASGPTGANATGAGIGALYTKSSPIQISRAGDIIYTVNKIASQKLGAPGKGSLSIVRVKVGGSDVGQLLTEIPVGEDPFSVSVSSDGRRIFVSNGADNSVTYISGAGRLGPFKKQKEIFVGSEPRGTAFSSDESKLYVANFSDGTLSVLDAKSGKFLREIDLTFNNTKIINPYALASTRKTLYITDFYGRFRPFLPVDQREAFDNGKEGRVGLVNMGSDQMDGFLVLSPLSNAGFPADRTAFDTANGAVNNTYRASGGDPTKVFQGAFFNQLHDITFDPASKKLFFPSIAAAPAPPVKFNVNIQAVVGVVDNNSRTELSQKHMNLNNLIKSETNPSPPFLSSNSTRLDRAFAADTTAMALRNGVALFVSRAGSFVMRGRVSTNGDISLERRNSFSNIRIPVGNIPTGVVISSDSTRAYVYAEVSSNITVINMASNSVIRTINSSETPTSSAVRRNLLGKLAFYTGMGLPADVSEEDDPKGIDTHRHRNMASDNNWSSCASCHPFGLADGVTWSFPTGPRQTVPLDGSFAPGSGIQSVPSTDQRVFNWNGVRGSVTDFSNNARGVQGGHGFSPLALSTIDNDDDKTKVSDASKVENHGPRLGVSNALDFMTEWVAKKVRVLNRPSNIIITNAEAGRSFFISRCASCHGGPKWTSSRREFDNLTIWPDPFIVGGESQSANLLRPAATVLKAIDRDGNGSFEFPILKTPTEGINTLDLTNPIEIRGLGPAVGKASAGAGASFNPPSLLNVYNSAPYGHHGRAQTLADVFEPIGSGGLGHNRFGLNGAQLGFVLEFLKTIDAKQVPIN